MMSELALLPSARSLRWWDIATTVYVVAVVGAGLFAGWQIWTLAELHRGLLDAADALDLTARAIGLLGQVPVVADGAAQLVRSVTETSAQVRTSAGTARSDVRSLAVVVGATIALLPIVPVLVLYLPLRVARHRELRGLRRLPADRPDPVLVEHLARGALHRGPFGQLRRLSGQPWSDVDRGQHLPFAAVGLRPPPAWDRDQQEARRG
jgi:hypothetical protein